eukprot:PhF_6_TR3458/c0_g1_i2/m.5049
MQRTSLLLWLVNVGSGHRGGKNLSWNPKFPTTMKSAFLRLEMQHPNRRPKSWNELEFQRCGYQKWPKDVGFWNAGDNWELTPEFQWRFYLHNRDDPSQLWTQGHNEQTVVALMPLCEVDPKQAIPKVEEIFRHHVQTFGADHVIYNVVMQAFAFAKEYDRAFALFQEMGNLGLVPNGQSYVNMMLASRLSKKPMEITKQFWADAVRCGAMQPVVRMDYEFELWMKQFDRLGSFSPDSNGYLSTKHEEGAVEVPRDMFALWGWDRNERKFIPRNSRVRYEVRKQTMSGAFLRGRLQSNFRRKPWYKYKGMFPWDFKGPSPVAVRQQQKRLERLFPESPPTATT